jgi:hypothetical protein
MIDKVSLFNPNSKALPDEHFLKDLAPDGKNESEKRFMNFVFSLRGNFLFSEDRIYDFEQQAEGAIFDLAFSDRKFGVLRHSLQQDNGWFSVRMILMNWFLNRGRFDLARKLTIPLGNSTSESLGNFLFSPILLFVLSLSSVLILLTFCIQPMLTVWCAVVVMYPLAVGLYSLRGQKKLRYNLLLRLELFNPRIVLTLFASILVVLNSKFWLSIALFSDVQVILILAAFGLLVSLIGWVYYYLKQFIEPMQAVKRGFNTVFRIFWMNLLLNAYFETFLINGFDLKLHLEAQSGGKITEIFLVSPFELVIFPNLLVSTTILSLILATGIEFLKGDGRLG